MPDWLNEALTAEAFNPGLAIARLADERSFGRGGFQLTSAAFERGGALDPCFTADEEDAVAPPLEWTAPPAGAQELVVIVEGASGKTDDPFCHWLVWGLAPQRGKLLEGEVPPRTGKNAHGNSEWLLPEPPEGAAPHHYVFQIFAVDSPLTLMPGADRSELLAQIEGHVVASALTVAHYTRQAQDEDAWADEDVD